MIPKRKNRQKDLLNVTILELNGSTVNSSIQKSILLSNSNSRTILPAISKDVNVSISPYKNKPTQRKDQNSDKFPYVTALLFDKIRYFH